MVESDEQHTAFYVENNIYNHIVMPFGLINVGATYQRMVNELFTRMIDVTMEAYVDDMLVKSIKGVDHVEELRKTFKRMRLHQVRLNPVKCAFGAQSDKFLGYMVSHRIAQIYSIMLD